MENKPKKYQLFAWEPYDAFGGMGDHQGEFDTIEECLIKAIERNWDLPFVEIIDRDTWEEVPEQYFKDQLYKNPAYQMQYNDFALCHEIIFVHNGKIIVVHKVVTEEDQRRYQQWLDTCDKEALESYVVKPRQ